MNILFTEYHFILDKLQFFKFQLLAELELINSLKKSSYKSTFVGGSLLALVVAFNVVHFREYIMGGGIHDNTSSRLRIENENMLNKYYKENNVKIAHCIQHLCGNFTMIWIYSSESIKGKYFEIFFVAGSSSLS